MKYGKILATLFGIGAVVAVGLAGKILATRHRAATHVANGILLSDKKDWAAAVAEFRDAVQLAPHNAEAHYFLGVAVQQNSNAAGAIMRLPSCIFPKQKPSAMVAARTRSSMTLLCRGTGFVAFTSAIRSSQSSQNFQHPS